MCTYLCMSVCVRERERERARETEGVHVCVNISEYFTPVNPQCSYWTADVVNTLSLHAAVNLAVRTQLSNFLPLKARYMYFAHTIALNQPLSLIQIVLKAAEQGNLKMPNQV